MHKNKILHRNLKLSNILLTEKMEIKITGFNHSVKLKSKEERRKAIYGTPNYVAPEVLVIKNGYSYKIDIWSLGIIIYKFIIGKLPFFSPDVNTIYEKIKNNEYTFPENSNISIEAKNLINNILITDPNKRVSLDKIINHNFFKLDSIPNSLPISP